MSLEPAFEIRKYKFRELSSDFKLNHYVKGLWPLVYILTGKKQAYIGETTDASSRMSDHLRDIRKKDLTSLHVISSSFFNKSAALDIESSLIKYITGQGNYKVLNGTLGLVNHTYYQKNEIYSGLFNTIWEELKSENIAIRSLKKIENTNLFKYSPYKSLGPEQKATVMEVLEGLLDPGIRSVLLEGGGGTGKTILAIYLFKLLQTAPSDYDLQEFGAEESGFTDLILRVKRAYPEPKMALVIPMASFRKTLKKVFAKLDGLNSDMVIGPAELATSKYDIVIVDESHRLRRRKNLGAYYGTFDSVSEKLGFDKYVHSELDWIIKQSDKQILFYDEYQVIKPTDALSEQFSKLISLRSTLVKMLFSQFRVKGGADYVAYIRQLLNVNFPKGQPVYKSPENEYEFLLFDSLEEMMEELQVKEDLHELSRLVAGYSWEWRSKKDKSLYDIKIGDVHLRWNSKPHDWIHSQNARYEVGCIHTTQGYDLNYAGIIFGNEISYDKTKGEIVIRKEHYFDKNGKHGIIHPAELKRYILNIYQTLMLRGILGTYIYVCDPDLREYFAQHIAPFNPQQSFRILEEKEVKPFVNSVPFYDIQPAAGAFSEAQQASDAQWIGLPEPYKPSRDYFVCRISGESMNKRIPDGSICLFRKDNGGSRNGKIVLAEHRSIHDDDFGAGYTIKEYTSRKEVSEDGWAQQSIILKPQSYDPSYKPLVLYPDDAGGLKVIGIFEAIL